MKKSLRIVAVTVLALGVTLLASVPASAAPRAATLELLGKSDLGGKGLNGEVATVGDTAIVGAGVRQGAAGTSGFSTPTPCPAVSAKVVDLSTPSSPRVAANIPIPDGVAAVDVAAMKMDTPSFRGDVAAVALVACGNAGAQANRGVAYYDVTNPREPDLLGRYMADSDRVQLTDPECDGQTVTRRCAQSQHSVSLVKRPDGKVLSLSTQPFAAASGYDSGDLRIVDITDPKNPTQVGDWPEKFGSGTNPLPPGYDPDGDGPTAASPPGFSNNGCRPFDLGRGATGTGDGTKALLAYWDQGLFSLDLSNPASPNKIGQWAYNRDDRSREGNAAYVESTTVGGRSLALMSDEDWIAPSTSLRIDGADEPLAGSKFACEAMFTLFDPEDDAAIYRKPNSEVPGDMAYVGRGCPRGGTVTADDPYLQDPNGKIIVVDATTQPKWQGVLPGGAVGCLAAAKVKRAQDAGAKGMVALRTNTSAPQAISFDGSAQGLNIPVVQIDTGDSAALRDAICPAPTTPPGCGDGGRTVSGAMVDKPGAWGGLHVLDVTNPGNPAQLSEYHTPAAQVFPPPDRGVYSIHHAIGGQGGLAYAAWNSAGLRVLDLAGGSPSEIASFVPPDTPDPSKDDANNIPASVPPKALVVGVAQTEKGQIVISDVNSGLYVLSLRDDSCPAGTSEGVTCKGLPGGGRQITGTPGNDTIVGTDENDVISSGGGDDVIVARGGDDIVDAGAGNDRVFGEAGNDYIVGGTGSDRLSGGTGADRIRGGSENDVIAGEDGNDVLVGEAGNDYIAGGTGSDRLSGGTGADRIRGDSGNDVITGEDGNDVITGDAGNDYIAGGTGHDRLSGGSGADRIRGDAGNDVIAGDDGNDVLTGEAGDDRLYGGPGRDRLSGGTGRNVVRQ